MPEPIQLETKDGLYLPEADLWLDPHRKHRWAFVSHGHADHFARHDRIITSKPNAHILRARYNVTPSRLEPLEFQQPFDHKGFTIRLFPAGHIYGSAMIHLTRKSDGATLLYTGDFKARRGLTAEEPVFRQADTLIMETTFGKPQFVFPTITEVSGDILNFVNTALEEGATPVLHAYSLGKAQEALAILTEARIPAILNSATAKMTTACREAGAGLPEPVLFQGTVPAGSCLICPPNSLHKDKYKGVENPRSAMLSGWALIPGAKYRYRCDAIFPLSDHADFPGLLEAVNRIRPKRILTVHGFTQEFATELRRLNHDAWSIDGDDQLELALRV
jgi:DNA ligase-1